MKRRAAKSLRGAPPQAPAQKPQIEPCVFCTEGASGERGHPGLAQRVHEIPTSARSYVPVTCSFCGSVWVRRRFNARVIEWLRVAG